MVSTTFKKAYELRKPSAGLIFHSDRGYQYTAHPFQKLLIDSGTKQSFSPSGSPQHNAVMEGFFSTLKKEELYRKEYHSEYEFRKSIKSYLDFYNNDRPHSTLNHKTPTTYESTINERKALAKRLDK